MANLRPGSGSNIRNT